MMFDVDKRDYMSRYIFITAASCFLKRMQENQGAGEFERGFIYQIYDRKLRIGGCDAVEK